MKTVKWRIFLHAYKTSVEQLLFFSTINCFLSSELGKKDLYCFNSILCRNCINTKSNYVPVSVLLSRELIRQLFRATFCLELFDLLERPFHLCSNGLGVLLGAMRDIQVNMMWPLNPQS